MARLLSISGFTDDYWGNSATMKHAIEFVLVFTFLGALTGAFMPLLLGSRSAGSYGLPNWADDFFNPVVVTLGLTISCGLFLGALTGLASAFSSGRFATVRCLLTISIPSLVAMTFSSPGPNRYFWALDGTPYVVGAVVATAMAVLLAYLGHRRTRKTLQG
jgi:hypothetical protein